MEWHLFHTILASFLALFGFLLDLQSFLGGLRFWRKGSGPRPIIIWPLVLYVLGVLACDGSYVFKMAGFAVGLLVHLISTVGIRWSGFAWSRSHDISRR